MTINEPDLAGITPNEMVGYWLQIEAAYPDRFLVSPEPSHYTPQYLAEFRAAYKAATGHYPRMDALGIHCYGDYWFCSGPILQVVDYAWAWNIPEVWVSEFGIAACGSTSMAGAQAQATYMVQFLRSRAKITRFAWFNSRTEGGEWWSFKPPECNMSLFTYVNGCRTAWGDWYAAR